jgi:nicotinate dehydrogenase subunit B
MGPVVKELAALSDRDIRAMAVYLGSFNDAATDGAAREALAVKLEHATATHAVTPASFGARLYQGACAVCHEVGGAPLLGSRPSLSLNSNLHSAVPDNLIQVILHGIREPVSSGLGYMPGFKDTMTDGQIAELVSYLRRQFAPDKPAWSGLEAAVGRIRQGTR